MRTTDIAVKNISNDNVLSELTLVGFDKTYLYTAENKYRYGLYKVFNLRPPEANILKQIALSVGTDCAVNRNVITSKIEYSDCLIGGSTAQIKQIIKQPRQPKDNKDSSPLPLRRDSDPGDKITA